MERKGRNKRALASETSEQAKATIKRRKGYDLTPGDTVRLRCEIQLLTEV